MQQSLHRVGATVIANHLHPAIRVVQEAREEADKLSRLRPPAIEFVDACQDALDFAERIAHDWLDRAADVQREVERASVLVHSTGAAGAEKVATAVKAKLRIEATQALQQANQKQADALGATVLQTRADFARATTDLRLQTALPQPLALEDVFQRQRLERAFQSKPLREVLTLLRAAYEVKAQELDEIAECANAVATDVRRATKSNVFEGDAAIALEIQGICLRISVERLPAELKRLNETDVFTRMFIAAMGGAHDLSAAEWKRSTNDMGQKPAFSESWFMRLAAKL